MKAKTWFVQVVRGAGALGVGLCLLLMIPSMAGADVSRRDGGHDELRKAQYLLREVAAQRDAARAGNAKLQAELDKTKAARDRLKHSKATLKRRLSRTESSLAQYRKHSELLTSRLEQSYGRIKDIIAKYRALARTLQATRLERAKLQVSLTDEQHDYKVCAENNVKLYHASLHMLSLYEHKGVMDSLKQDEPFVQTQRVKLENLVQDYKFKVEDLRVDNRDHAHGSNAN